MGHESNKESNRTCSQAGTWEHGMDTPSLDSRLPSVIWMRMESKQCGAMTTGILTSVMAVVAQDTVIGSR